MLAYYHAVREAANRVAGVAHEVILALREGRVEQEPALTDRMLGGIEANLATETADEFTVNGIRWRAKTLTDRGPGSQESKYGADFMGILDISLPSFKVSKGFLAQAKLIRRGQVDDLQELKKQCVRMLNLSAASFVFLYDENGIRVVPAMSVVSGDTQPRNLYGKSAARFFEEHFKCFIGDGAIQTPTPDTLKSLRNRYEARLAMQVQAEADFG